jgi:hypothetical protein
VKGKFIVSIFFMLALACSSQNTSVCGFDELYKNSLKQYWETLGQRKNDGSKIATVPVYTIPMVFHILHQYGVEDISDAQVKNQVNILNRDYRKQNPDTSAIISPFQAADVHVEFALATRDTNGNCTTGIVRHYDPNTNWSGPNPSNYAYTWNSTKYLNVYVVKSITGFSAGGYSSLPGLNPGFMDVIVIMNNSIGSIGTGDPFYRCRLLTHEVGHWLGLIHTWGTGQVGVSCGDDGINDTPITKGFGNCPVGSPAICNPPIVENYQNYMEYSGCIKMFTADQAAFMVATLNSTVSGRNNVCSNSNLISTGVINPSYSCAPIADCYPATSTVCTGESLTLHDVSYNGTVTARSWSATGGAIITNSTASNPSVIFPSAGIQTITLIASNGSGASTASNTVAVLSGSANVSVNYPESFESTGLPANFSIVNPDNDVTWSPTSQAAGTGTNSYYIDGNSDAPNSLPDILETPSYDFSQDPNASFTFKYAYAKKSNSNTDVFKVMASSDCGGSWVNIYQPSNSSLASASGGVSNISFTPAPNQFVTYTLSDHPNFFPFLGMPWVKIRLSFKEDSLSGYGNNIFLDDINFNSYRTEGFATLSKVFGCNLYPNPSAGKSTLEFELSDLSEIVYSVSNTVGELLFIEHKTLNPGKHSISINEDGKLKPGLYFLNMDINKQKLIKKLIINSN